MATGSLFGADLPEGFKYRDEFITPDEETRLVEHINSIAFANFEMRGVVAKRRVAFFGASYDRPTGRRRRYLSFSSRCADGWRPGRA